MLAHVTPNQNTGDYDCDHHRVRLLRPIPQPPTESSPNANQLSPISIIMATSPNGTHPRSGPFDSQKPILRISVKMNRQNLKNILNNKPTTVNNFKSIITKMLKPSRHSAETGNAPLDNWPDSFLNFLNSLSLKQQQSADLNNNNPLGLARQCSPSTDQTIQIIATPSISPVSSLAIDDRDFELVALRFSTPDDIDQMKLADDASDKNSVWLINFANNIHNFVPLPSHEINSSPPTESIQPTQTDHPPETVASADASSGQLNDPPIRFERIAQFDPTPKQLESILHVQDFDEDECEAEASLATRSVASPAVLQSETGSVRSEGSRGCGGSQSQEAGPAEPSKEEREDGKYSLLQFALYNFREAISKYSLESRASKTQAGPGDTSTLRGSLKLIESLRSHERAGAGSKQDSARRASKPAGQPQEGAAGSDWTWRELAEMVKFTRTPIRQSLLRLPSEELNRRAVECFLAIMQYMGDAPAAAKGQSAQEAELNCVYLILMNCHNFPLLRDELYCQLIKQTTNNRSESNPDSCLKGWRLFSILAAYFDCSQAFKPYLLKQLETAAYDKRRAYCSVALFCLQNLRKTFKYGGRKNVPSIEEIAATSAGRNSKRQIYRLPGGTERVINTKSTTVVEDIIHEICSSMFNISDPNEMLEFSLYCIADGDLYTMPLNRDEYILDITTELIKNHQQYFLIFCRSIWHYPLRLENKLYIEVIFNQIAPDYLEGLLLILPSIRLSASGSRPSSASSGGLYPAEPLRLKSKLVKEVARIAALLHRASGTDYMPHKDEVRYLLPKPIVAAMKQQQRNSSLINKQPLDSARLSPEGSLEEPGHSRELDEELAKADPLNPDTVPTSSQKWIELVQSNWREMSAFDTLDAKAQFLDIVRHWPLFGSSFFAIKLIQRDLIQPMDLILALNKLGIQMLDTVTHETVHSYTFNEVISTRKVRSEDGALFLDMKCGTLMKRTIVRIQTDQAHEISRLIKQYIDIELIQQKNQQQPILTSDNPMENHTDGNISASSS